MNHLDSLKGYSLHMLFVKSMKSEAGHFPSLPRHSLCSSALAGVTHL